MSNYFNPLSTYTNLEKLDILTSKLDQMYDVMSLAMEFATIGVWDWNIKTNELTWDANMLKLFNVSSFGGTYTEFIKLLQPSDCEKVDRALQKAIDSHEIYDCVYGLRNISRVIRGRGKCIYDNETLKPIRFIGVCIECIISPTKVSV